MCDNKLKSYIKNFKKLTEKGSIITVTGLSHRDKNKNPYLIIECSMCSKDKELFPEPLIIRKSHLDKGSLPCVCAPKSPKLSWTQFEILIKRRCKELGYNYRGVSTIGKTHSTTKILLHNPKTSNTWGTTKVSAFLRGSLDPKCPYRNDNKKILAFVNTGKFTKGTLFLRDYSNEKRVNKWLVICPVCKNDAISRAGLCDGTFISTTAALKKANPCRCSKSATFTKNMRDLQIKDRLKSIGGTFLKWRSFTGNAMSSKFDWICSFGHNYTSTVNNFLNSNSGCGKCSFTGYKFSKEEREFQINKILKEGAYFLEWEDSENIHCYSNFSWICARSHVVQDNLNNFLNKRKGGCPVCNPHGGFKKAIPAYLYIVRWYGFGESYIKFGITNNSVKSRVVQQGRNAKLDYEILHTFYHEKGYQVWECEKILKNSLKTAVCPKEYLPEGYTETTEDSVDNLQFLLKLINKNLLK